MSVQGTTQWEHPETPATPLGEPSVVNDTLSSLTSRSLHVNVSVYGSSIVLPSLPMRSVTSIDAVTSRLHLAALWPSLAPLVLLLLKCEPLEMRPLSSEHGQS